MRIVLYVGLALNAAYLYLNVEHWRSPKPSEINAFSDVKQLILISESAAEELRTRRESAPVRAVALAAEGLDVAPTTQEQTSDAVAGDEASKGDEEKPLKTAMLILSCYSVGPIAHDSEQQSVAAWLSEQGAHARLREDERRELARYWVHLSPLASLEAARTQVAALRDAGVDDMHVIRRGNMANAISLGLYRRKTHLERRIAKLEKAGVTPQVHERYRTYKSSWFDVVIPADSPFNDEALAERYPGVESRSRACGSRAKQPKATG